MFKVNVCNMAQLEGSLIYEYILDESPIKFE
jgi:hypothetical protein